MKLSEQAAEKDKIITEWTAKLSKQAAEKDKIIAALQRPPLNRFSELVKDMNFDIRKQRHPHKHAHTTLEFSVDTDRLYAAVARMQATSDTASWTKEIPAVVRHDLEECFAILDEEESGAVTVDDWTGAGLDEELFYE